MAFNPITVNKGPSANPHIYAEDDAAIFQSMFGEDGILDIGSKLELSIQSNNLVRMSDGALCVGGHIGRIKYADYVDLTIDNGETGHNRNDLIIGSFRNTGEHTIDTFEPQVVKGTPATGDAVDPTLTEGSLYEGEYLRQVAVARVKLEGLNIVGIDMLLPVIPSIPSLKEQLDELNRKLPVFKEIYSGIANHAQYDIPDITPYDLLVIYGGPGTYANTSVVIPVESIVYKDDGQFALGVHQSSTIFWELEFNFPTSTKMNIANYKNQSWTTPAIRKILAVKL